jgi:YD repeat-containing protein
VFCAGLLAWPLESSAQPCPTQAAASQPMTLWTCDGGLCSSSHCPVGSAMSIYSCAVAAYYKGAAGDIRDYGNITYLYTTFAGGGTYMTYWFQSQVGGQYTINLNAIPVSGCPSYWVQAPPALRADTCGNCVNQPIDPAVESVIRVEEDVRFASPSAIGYTRYYNSADTQGADGVPGWRHSYGRSVQVIGQYPAGSWAGASETASAQYRTPSEACTSGFPQVQASVAAWTGAIATYTNGVCVISKGSATLGSIQLSALPLASAYPSPIEYDLVRDDGQTLRYTLQNGIINNPAGTTLQLAVTDLGFTVKDGGENIETYNHAGVLQSVIHRSGVVQTLSYDVSGQLLSVVDSLGNSINLTRNAQGGVSEIALSSGGRVTYDYDSAGRLSTVTNLDASARTYEYTDVRFINALTAIIDENSKVLSSWTYGAQEHAEFEVEEHAARWLCVFAAIGCLSVWGLWFFRRRGRSSRPG